MRDVVILYFSATGNTELVARQMGRAFEARGSRAELVSVEDRRRMQELDYAGKLIGVGFPCYAFRAPRIVEDALQALPVLREPVPAFVFGTKGWSTGYSLQRAAKVLRGKNAYPIKMKGFFCPNNGWLTLFSPRHILCRLTRYERDLLQNIEGCVSEIVSLVGRFDEKPFAIPVIEWPHKTLLGALLGRMEGYFMPGPEPVDGKCTGCGVCAARCPSGNIQIDGERRIRFKSREQCIKCIRCISDCPADAIQFGRHTIGKPRYNRKLRREYLRRYGLPIGRD